MSEIKITTIKCGSMRVRPYDAYKADNSLFAKRIEIPINAFLIEHPIHGNILVDTGWSKDVNAILPKHLLEFYQPKIENGETAKEQLEAIGIRPEDIDLVLLTHLDVDHTCAVKDFAGKTKRIVCAELEYFYSCRNVYKKRQVWDTWLPYVEEKDRIHYRASVLGPVGRGFDLFGDDSILCIYCPGHTDGIFSIIVSQGPSNRFLCHGDGVYGGEFAIITSDVAFSQRNIDDMVVPGYGFDRQQQLKAISFISKLQNDPKCKATLFSHDSNLKTIILN